METGPNSLIVPEGDKIAAFKLSRWPLYAVIAVAAVMVGVLVWSISFSGKNGSVDKEQKDLDLSESGPPLVMAENRGGLASSLPVGVARPDMPKAPAPKEPLIVVQDKTGEADRLRLQELENLRRRKAQAQLEGLTSPFSLKRSQSVAGKQAPSEAAPSRGREVSAQMPGMENGYDMAAQKDKEGFFSRASRDESWISPHVRTAGQQYELKTERVIPAAMVTGINSDLPGQIQAQVTQDVYDSATGDYLLIPKGAKLTGTYDSRVIFGQRRVLAAWTRIVYPDGSALSLGAMPGADIGGYAGFEDEVNNHYLKIYGNALLMSLIGGGMSWAVDNMDSSGGSDTNKPTMQQEVGTALASQIGQTSLSLLQKNINLAPTLEVRPGYEFVIVVTKDIVFDRPYRPYR